MPRIARIVAVDFPHHVIQRGNNRAKIFFAIETRQKYLELLKEYAHRWKVSILAYCLMSNHLHLLVKPHQENALAKMMQGTSQGYTKYINRRYKRTGRLWESRYYSCIVEEESYLWSVLRYIEQNPRRARVVRKEENYPYSSARAHILGIKDEVLSGELINETERPGYVRFIRAPIPEKELTKIRLTTKAGRVLGDNKFIKQLEKGLKGRFQKKVPGRPVK